MECSNKYSRNVFLKRLAGMGFATAAYIRGLDAWSQSIPKSLNEIGMSESEKKFVPVMITPFMENGKIDFRALSQLIDFYLAAGVKGFFANCLSSEMYQLDDDEKFALTQFVVARVNGRVPVVATGSFGNSIDERATFAKKIYDKGIDAVILISSHFATRDESDEILLGNLEQMLKLTGQIPLGLYECPSPYKRIISPQVFKALLDTNRLVYHKDTSIDKEKVAAKLALVKGSALEFYDAHTANAIFSLQRGAKGLSAISGNFYPEILVWMCNNANNASKADDVKWLQQELDIAEEIISQSYPMSSKYFLNKRGVNMQPVSRSFTGKFSDQQRSALDQMHERFLGWCERLGVEEVVL
jgi:4-hydroxy-tetrahydrodipicolinate synthase